MTKKEKWLTACFVAAITAGVIYDVAAMLGQGEKISNPEDHIACPGDWQLKSLDCQRNHHG